MSDFPGGEWVPLAFSIFHDAFDVTYPLMDRQTPVKTLPCNN